MMRKLIFSCVITLLSVVMTGCSNKADRVTQLMADNNVAESYNDKEVTMEDINLLVEAAQSVPSVRSVSQWQFIAIGGNQTSKLANIKTLGKGMANSKAAILVCGLTRRMNDGDARAMWIQDCSAATQNIVLTARAMGMTPNMIRVYPVQQRISDVKAALDLDPGVVPYSIIALGYADEENITVETPAEQPELKVIGTFED